MAGLCEGGNEPSGSLKASKQGLELKGLHQLLVYADDVNMLGENPQTIRENTGILLEASKAIGLKGLPQWQFKFTPMDLTPWAEQMFVLIAPHLLQSDVNNPLTQSVDWCDMPYNHLDPAIFKTRAKSSKKKADPAKIKPS
ncbi:hypothetical protein ANN_09238 [Periplaneta americana]|uniref:Reverse transcriptase domain-containing protein n=1 Tax=Periplaneta americana TaxID=6978 RepID=A0ABQ8TKT0_PERAM|nr:hypothetical protein ANN_09238 [Periplaneta americana]